MSNKPLDGIRVLEIGAYISAPYAGSLLAALGADVVKVEPPEGDAFRRGMGIGSDYFVQYNAGKRSIAIDLKSKEGVALVKDMLPKFDVLIENMRPGKMDALGLGKDACRAVHAGLVYASISGFGDGGPLVDRPAYDTIGQSYGGLYSLMHDAGKPGLTGSPVADLITGVSCVMGILAGLVAKGRTGKGSAVGTSLLEAVSLITVDSMTQAFEMGEAPTRQARHPQAQNFCLKTSDGAAVTLHLSSSQKFWTNLLRVVEREDLLQDKRFATYADRMVPDHYFALVDIFAKEIAKRPLAEWEEKLTALDVPYAPVLDLLQYADHPQMQWLQMTSREPGGKLLVRPPWRFDGERPDRTQAAPHIGQHTREILQELRTPEQVEALIAGGTVNAVPR
ncbi:CaiB/BaiF CoA transferase family protein [Ramlibacter sp.]|uniref:CaiB/BaiF CoA transferase family protein n=1 Tax=Ramlibacter sp. TaxID=1917967 RepID=UPI003D14FDE3